MHHFLKNLAVVGAMGIFALSNASAATVLWNGVDRPSTPSSTTGGSYTEGGTGFGAIFSADDPSTGYMRQLNPGVPGGSSNFGLDSAASHLNRAAGWSVEINLQCDTTQGDFAMYAGIYDNAGGLLVLFEPGQVEVYNGDFSPAVPLFTQAITGGFHSYYFSMAPGGSSVDFYLDGVLANSAAPSGGSGASFAFGDGTSGANASGIWDYVYVNGPAVPEPATLGLAAVAALGLLRRR